MKISALLSGVLLMPSLMCAQRLLVANQGDHTLVIVDTGMAKSLSTTTLRNDVYAFIFAQRGLMGGIGIQGSRITRIPDAAGIGRGLASLPCTPPRSNRQRPRRLASCPTHVRTSGPCARRCSPARSPPC